MPWHWPGYNYLGPGTNRFDRPAKNRLDAAARRHDKRYKRYGKKAYFYYNKADEEFIKSTEKIPGIASAVSRGVFQLKKSIAPSLPEKEMPKRRSSNVPPTPAKRSSRRGSGSSMSVSGPMTMSSRRSSRSGRTVSSRTKSTRTTSSGSTAKSSGKGMLGRVKARKQSRKKVAQELYWNKQGIVTKVEAGGVLSDAQAVYLGHSTCANKYVIDTVLKALCKQIFKRLKWDVNNCDQTDWGGNAVNGLSYDFTVRSSPATGIGGIVSLGLQSLTTPFSLTDLVNHIVGHLQTALTAGVQYEFYKMNVFIKTQTTIGVYFPAMTFDLKQMKFDIKIQSILKVQNQTFSNTDASDPNRDTKDDVQANPLIGYLYRKTKWANHLELKGVIGGSPIPLATADNVTGVLSFTGSYATDLELKKPPTKAYQVGCNRQSYVTVEPGSIISSKLYTTAKFGFNKFVQLFMLPLDANTNFQTAFGTTALFGLEKAIAGLQTNQSLISLQYQVDNMYCVVAKPGTSTFTADNVVVMGS